MFHVLLALPALAVFGALGAAVSIGILLYGGFFLKLLLI